MQSDAVSGLSAGVAAARLARDGPNEIVKRVPTPAWRRFLAQFEDALVILLLIATAISVVLWWADRDGALPYEALAILAVVLFNATLGFIQEARAEAAVNALRALSADEASVLRDGIRQTIPAAQL
ncbi:MAG TPA: cation-transporting P-type ATPase, partial [Longimicrobiales bacterium]